MFRTLLFTVMCLFLASATSAMAQLPSAKKSIKNKTARAARKSYDTALAEAKALIAKAKKEYIAKLNTAIKEAGAAGDIDDANRIVAERKNVEANLDGKTPIDNLRKRIEGTVWNVTPFAGHWFKFGKNGIAAKKNGDKIAWVAAPNRTLVLQSYSSTYIYIWQLDENFRVAKITQFSKTKFAMPPARIRKGSR